MPAGGELLWPAKRRAANRADGHAHGCDRADVDFFDFGSLVFFAR